MGTLGINEDRASKGHLRQGEQVVGRPNRQGVGKGELTNMRFVNGPKPSTIGEGAVIEGSRRPENEL